MTARFRGHRVLVTGASGLVGHAAGSRLVAEGAVVTAVGGQALQGATNLSLDLTRDAWPAGPWHSIVHCAARLPARFEGEEAARAVAENRTMDRCAVALAQTTGAHLVFLSSASVYGAATGEIDETTPASPALDYARAKLDSEAEIVARGIPATVFRLVAPYGPRQSRNTVLLRFVQAALDGVPLRYYGTGSRTQDFLHVDDIAAAIAMALQAHVHGLFLLASGRAVSMRTLAQLVVSATGSNSTVEPAGLPDPEEGRSITYRITRVHECLGFSPSISLEDGVAEWGAIRRAEQLSRRGP